MSMHKIPLTELEREGLIKHRLTVDKPSQLSDAFRLGMKWALDEVNWISVKNGNPSKSGEYRVRYDGHYSDDFSRFNYSVFPWLRYWSDERFCGRAITHWMPLK